MFLQNTNLELASDDKEKRNLNQSLEAKVRNCVTVQINKARLQCRSLAERSEGLFVLEASALFID